MFTRSHTRRAVPVSRWLLVLLLSLPGLSQAGFSIHYSAGGYYGGYYGYGYRGYGPGYYPYPFYGYRLPRYGYYGAAPYYRSRVYRYPYSYPRYSTVYPDVYSAPRVYTVPGDASRTPSNIKNSGESATLPVAEQAWDLLAQGDYRSARKLFAEQATRYPEAGIPKAGYALASAAGGDLNTGIWAMRRALRLDAAGLEYLPLNAGRERVLKGLVERYTATRNAGQVNMDNAFMIAALHYLRRDYTDAQTAVDRAIAQGDQSTSTANLAQLLRQRTN